MAGVRRGGEFAAGVVLCRRIKDVWIVLTERDEIMENAALKGITFVVTGDMKNFVYKDEEELFCTNDYSDLKAFIEERGGFLQSAISSGTDYLICK